MAQSSRTAAGSTRPVGYELPVGRHRVQLGERTLVMGIINVTPDSFSGDGLAGDVAGALSQALRFAAAGADLLDVGGESTRPGSEGVTAEHEQRRVLPVIEAIAARVDLPISVDTMKPAVAAAALDAGAGMINDVFALRADGMLELAAERQVPVCVMHMQGLPRDMQLAPTYDEVVADILGFLAERVAACEAVGLPRERIFVDPGLGFGKTLEHNLEILRRLREFRSLGCPVLIGPSRKAFIGRILNVDADQRLEGTAAACAVAIAHGADMIRVHDVRELVRVVRVADALVRGPAPAGA